MRTQKQTIAAAIIAAAGCGLLADNSAFAQPADLIRDCGAQAPASGDAAEAGKTNNRAMQRRLKPTKLQTSKRPHPMQPLTMPSRAGRRCGTRSLRCRTIGPQSARRRSKLHIHHEPPAFRCWRLRYYPNTPATDPQRLDNGVNARRARIGVVGKFLGDWTTR